MTKESKMLWVDELRMKAEQAQDLLTLAHLDNLKAKMYGKKRNKRCDSCEYFSHALEPMEDHYCIFYGRKIINIFSDAGKCKHFKRRSV